MRAFGAWLLIVPVAVINGGIRQAMITPRTRDTLEHAISTIVLCGEICCCVGSQSVDTVRYVAGGLVDWCLVDDADAPVRVSRGSRRV